MTKERAIALLRKYLREDSERLRYNVTYVANIGYEIMRSEYEGVIVRVLIMKIKQCNKDPYEFIQDFYFELDDILCESGPLEFTVHAHASVMENVVGDILRFFRKEMK